MHLIFLSLFAFQLSLFGLTIEWIPESDHPPAWYSLPVNENDLESTSFFLHLRYRLKQEGYELIASSRKGFGNGELIIFTNIKSLRDLKRAEILHKPTILINWEPPTYDRLSVQRKHLDSFEYVYTWNNSLLDGRTFLKFRYPSLQAVYPINPSFHQRKLCCLMNTNHYSNFPNELYSTRRSIAQFYDQMKNGPDYFSLYGKRWEKANLSQLTSSTPENKGLTLQNYKFCFAYENWYNDVDYISEKIFDSFVSGTVPIYLGATTISKSIPKECYIDANEFESLEALHQFLLAMDEETWLQHQKAAALFVKSEEAQIFTLEPLLQSVIEKIKLLCPLDNFSRIGPSTNKSPSSLLL